MEAHKGIMINSLKKPLLIIALIAVIITLTVTVLILSHKKSTTKTLALPSQTVDPPVFAQQKNTPVQQNSTWHTVTIKPGNTLQSIFTELHIPNKDLWQLIHLHDARIVDLKPNEKLKLLLDSNHNLLALHIPLNKDKILQVERQGKAFHRNTKQLATDTVISYASGNVSSSLKLAAREAGLSNKMYYQLIKMFEGQLNFRRDIRRNDHFALLYQEEYLNGHKVHAGKILAAELKTHNKTYHSINFSYPINHKGYYTPSGKSVQSRFLTYPLHYKRISSHFSYTRVDPILHRVHPHLGVDFAAKRGTPIHSIGDGRIVFIGKEHGYGNAIRIRYDRHYSALYGHMRRFAKNLKVNQYIKKSQVIGYVGSTGWSTGPHLHFSFYVNGKPKNWLALKPPTTPPIPRRYRKQFQNQVKTLLAVLKLHQNTELAENDLGSQG